MIELIYNEEEDVTLEEKALPEPKNIKQVGEPREYKKIFMEDFVHTFLQQYSAQNGQRICLAVLLGDGKRCGGKRHLYVKSAFPVEGVTEKQGKYNFTEKVWGTVYQECEKYFPGQEIVGWFLSRPGFAAEKNEVMEETHRTYFSGADKVLFVMEPLEGDSAFFGFDGNRFAKQSGYYIYYEKNEPMREFIMEKNSEQKKSSENEKPDVAMANFRKILKEKQEQNEKRRKRAVSYGTKAAVLMVLFVGAVTLKNQTDKIAEMEQQMSDFSIETETEPAASDEVVVEELEGEVEEQPVAIEEPEPEEKPQELPVTWEEEQEDIDTVPEMPEKIEEPQEEAQEEVQQTAAEAPVYEEYTVQEGDTLAGICRERYGDDGRISEICELNDISDGDYIQVGEIILLP